MSKNYFKRAVVMFISFVMLITIFPDVSFTVNAAYENTHVNTGNQREDIVAVAETQIGYHEGSNNDTKYNRWNGKISGYPVDGYGYAWCQCFVSWCANQAGIPTSVIPKTAGTYTGKDFFVKQGTYKQSKANGGSYIPQRGDIIYFGAGSSPSHVGIVSGCNGTNVYTIEGNYSDKVGQRTISLSNSYIIGYGVPNYSGDPIPVFNSVKVNCGTSTTATTLTWDKVSDAYVYYVKIWNGTVWVGDAYKVDSTEKTSYNITLPAGHYQAYIDSWTKNSDSATMSNIVSFDVKENSKLTVTPGKSSSDTEFKWEKVNNAYVYYLKIWKNKCFEGDAYKIVSSKDNSYKLNLPAGKYEAYIDTWTNGSDSAVMSNVVSFTVENGAALTVKAGSTATNTVFTWNTVPNAYVYYVKIWNGKVWVGDPYKVADTTENTYSIKLPAGNYQAYVDTWIKNKDTADMSNVISFTITDKKPTYSKIEVLNPKEVYYPGDEITFKALSDYATDYTIGINCNSKRIVTEHLSSEGIYKLIATETGTYSAYVTGYSGGGGNWIDSDKLSIEVVNRPVVNALEIVNAKEKYSIGDEISFKSTSNYNSEYFYDVFLDSESLMNEPVQGDGIFTLNISSPGKYTVYSTAFNDINSNGTISNKIEFEVELSSVIGDCNNDGTFTIADVVVLQKWILAEPNIKLANWKAADLCEDDRLDVFDLCLMKRMLVENS